MSSSLSDLLPSSVRGLRSPGHDITVIVPVGLWQSVHIDDLRRSKDMISDMSVLQNLTISQMLCEDLGKAKGELRVGCARCYRGVVSHLFPPPNLVLGDPMLSTTYLFPLLNISCREHYMTVNFAFLFSLFLRGFGCFP